jgi:positive regulator of sigma E activity
MDTNISIFAIFLATIWSTATVVLKANDFLTERRDRIMNLDCKGILKKEDQMLIYSHDYKPTLRGAVIFFFVLVAFMIVSSLFYFNIDSGKRLFLFLSVLVFSLSFGIIFFFAALRDHKAVKKHLGNS